MCARGFEGSSQKLRFTKAQLRVLEDTFERLQRPNAHQKSTLAMELGVQPRQVEVWFQNRRARGKAKRNESDCEVLRQRCQDLLVENHHLSYLIQVHSYTPMHPVIALLLLVCLGCYLTSLRRELVVSVLRAGRSPSQQFVLLCTADRKNGL